MQYLTHRWIWMILTFHLNQLILKLLDSKSDAFLLVYSQGLTFCPSLRTARTVGTVGTVRTVRTAWEDRTLEKYFLNPRKKDADQDEIEEKLIPVKVTVPDEPVRKVSPWLIVHDTHVWLIFMTQWLESQGENEKSREDAADGVANVLSRSLTLDDEDVEIDIDVSESRIDDVGTVLNCRSLKNSMDPHIENILTEKFRILGTIRIR